MKKCDRCGLDGRVRRIVQKDDGEYAEYICIRPGCTNFKKVFAEEKLQDKEKEKKE